MFPENLYVKYDGSLPRRADRRVTNVTLNPSTRSYVISGVSLRAEDIYNPYSVMCAADLKQYGSYWKKTSAAGSLAEYLDMDFETYPR